MLGVLVGKYFWILALFFCSSPKHLSLATSKAAEYRELSIFVWSSVIVPGYWFFQPPTTCYNMSYISKYFGKNSLWTYGNSQVNFFLSLISPPDENSVKSSCKLIPLPSVIKFAFVSASAWANVFPCVAHVQQSHVFQSAMMESACRPLGILFLKYCSRQAIISMQCG